MNATTSEPKIRVLVVDDHQLFRSGLELLLQNQPDMEVVAGAQDGPAALKCVTKLSPDLVIMDIQLPGINGIRVSEQILKSFPRTRIVLVSGLLEASQIHHALQAGVSGYVQKESSFQELAMAVRLVMEGKLYLSPEADLLIRQEDVSPRRDRKISAKPLFSERELQVMKLIGAGLRNKEVADRLNISPKSVETYKLRSMAKLGLKNSAELIRYAICEGIAPLYQDPRNSFRT